LTHKLTLHATFVGKSAGKNSQAYHIGKKNIDIDLSLCCSFILHKNGLKQIAFL
jgi:hypothetical protein